MYTNGCPQVKEGQGEKPLKKKAKKGKGAEEKTLRRRVTRGKLFPYLFLFFAISIH